MAEHWYDLFDRTLTRRDMLRIGADAAACIALGAWPGEAAQAPRLKESPFAWGVASGDPMPGSVVLWTRLDSTQLGTARSVPVRWEVSENDSFTRIVQRGTAAARPQLGYSVHAEVNGLRAGRDYWYRFTSAGHLSASGRTRTAPEFNASPGDLDFAFVSCNNYEHGHFTAYRHLVDEDVDFVVHLGDYIYERTFSPALSVRKHEAGEVFTLADYRRRYETYRSDTDLQAAHARCPWIVTTDDHEVANNYADAIAEAPYPRDKFLLRRAAAYQAYYEFMPLRRSSMPAGPALQLFRRLRFGNLAEFHVLDTRQYRSDQPCNDGRRPKCPEVFAANRTMLGRNQERWLEQGLRQSRARWNVLANQVMIAEMKSMLNDQVAYSMDKWDAYAVAQQRMLKLLASVPQSNPVVITGDIHTNWVADLRLNFEDPSSRAIATEFVGTSITSGGDGSDAASPMAAANPHIKYFNNRRGYVRVAVKPSRMTADYRVVPFVSKPGAPVETRASWTVEAGQPGAEKA